MTPPASLPLALDAMGGDHGAAPNVAGAVAAARAGVRLLLVGDPVRLHAELGAHGDTSGLPLELVPASDAISMEEHASDVRGRPEASINVASRLVKEGRAGALVSMGHSGATMASALFTLGRLPGVDRPAILQLLPTRRGVSALLDVGANADVKAAYLVQWARLASAYLRVVRGVAEPTVGLLSIGEEAHKGSALVLEAHPLLAADPALRFHGNVEGRDLFQGTTDVVVTDGFTGNVVLKLAEGEAKVLFSWVRDALNSSLSARLGGLLVRRALRGVAAQVDPASYGASPLLGLRGLAYIGHGSSDARAVENALMAASRDVAAGLGPRLAEAMRAGAPER